MKLFNYIFYRVCNFYKKKKDSAAESTANLIVSLVQFFTILDLFIIIRIFWEYNLPDNFSKYWAIPLIIFIPIINWNKYIKPKKFREYRKNWKNEEIVQKKNRGIFLVLYLITSILFPILYGLVKHNF